VGVLAVSSNGEKMHYTGRLYTFIRKLGATFSAVANFPRQARNDYPSEKSWMHKVSSTSKTTRYDAGGTLRGESDSWLSRPIDLVEGKDGNNIPRSMITLKITLESTYKDMLTKILSKRFPNGFRQGSPIELSRFRGFAVEDFGEELVLSDEELNKLILDCGILFDGKVYVVRADIAERIKSEIDSVVADGVAIIFYSVFYSKNEDWLFLASVISKEMLKAILVNLYPQYIHKQNYFSPITRNENEVVKIGREALRVWGDDVLLSYGQLSKLLPYIPVEKIKYALSQNGDFIWNAYGVYTHIDKVDITGEERVVITEYVAAACGKNGYASFSDIPLGGIVERNYELSVTAIHNAIYRICLSDKFNKNGKIVTRKGEALNALTIMKEYCLTIDKCSLDDLLNFERELTGEVHRWIPMEAGNTILVRIDKDTYVADRSVHFNADLIDEAIGLFVKDNYLPLKAFTTFGAFPDCGQTWNLFLLESYCRRFSLKFRFDTPSVNSRNAGAVIRKSCGMDYTEIMTDAVANADVPLNDTAVGRFLFDSGYTGRSTNAKVSEIIDKAKAIRRGLSHARN
jgi:hypothetical protein